MEALITIKLSETVTSVYDMLLSAPDMRGMSAEQMERIQAATLAVPAEEVSAHWKLCFDPGWRYLFIFSHGCYDSPGFREISSMVTSDVVLTALVMFKVSRVAYELKHDMDKYFCEHVDMQLSEPGTVTLHLSRKASINTYIMSAVTMLCNSIY
jgi:hypothetical protein